jgi:MazG family protein
MDRLVELMARLRGPEGCPWDRAQNYDSMKALLLEEAYEVIDAVNERDFGGLEDELGDLLFQVVFYSRLAEEEGRFTLADVMERLYSKLVRRHPHVFGEKKARTADEALKSWNAVKEQEREDARGQNADEVAVQVHPGAGGQSEQESLLDGIAATLPSTLEAHELGLRAAEGGFDWPRAADVFDKVEEELAELKQQLRTNEQDSQHFQVRARIEDELGDLLFSLSQLARHLGTDPESCLRRGNRKFRRRFQSLERQVARQGRELGDCNLEELEAVWSDTKAEERHQAPPVVIE